MSDTITAPIAAATITPATTQEPAKLETAPAVPVPPKTIPNPEAALAAIKARIAQANQPKAPEPVKVEPGKEPDIKPDLASIMAELVKLQSRERELKDQVKSSDDLRAAADEHKQLKELWAKDPRQALAKLSGKEAEEATADIVELFYGDMASGAGKGGTEAEPKPNKTEAVLMAKLEEFTKKLEALEGQRKSELDQTSASSIKAQEEGTKAYLRAVAIQHRDKFEILSRDENIQEAIDKAMTKSAEVAQAMVKEAADAGTALDLAKLSKEQAETLASRTLAAIESDYEQLGKRFAKAQAPTKPSVYDRPLTRPGMQFEKAKANESFDEYKARRRKEWEQATGG